MTIYDLATFEKNQQVTLSIKDNILECQSGQTTSTPGVRRQITLPELKTYCLEVVGWANCPRAFVQILDPTNNQRLISRYKFLSQDRDAPPLLVNFSPIGIKIVNITILFGGSTPPTLNDKFWLRSVKITDRDLSHEPTAPHRQEVVINRPFDDPNKQRISVPLEPKAQRTKPSVQNEQVRSNPEPKYLFFDRKSAVTAFQEDPANLIRLTDSVYLYLDQDGYVRYVNL
jgi:hypothetical protein